MHGEARWRVHGNGSPQEYRPRTQTGGAVSIILTRHRPGPRGRVHDVDAASGRTRAPAVPPAAGAAGENDHEVRGRAM
ncbi:hypothetical protein GCM10009835_45060 [Planosporangium flavigriseum]